MSRYYLSLGSNIEPEQHLRAASRELRERFGALEISPVYRSIAVGFDGSAFWNLTVALDSDLDATALADWLHALEDAHGRKRGESRYSDRTLDLDIVAINGRATDRPELCHAFVLAPLADITPDTRAPAGDLTIAELWRNLQIENPQEIADLQRLDIDLSSV